MSEIRIHRSLKHPSIVHFENFFEDSNNVYILLELCQNQTLNELLKRRKRLTELEVQCYVVHIVDGLKYIHSRRIIHRDLKLGNLFLNDKMEEKIGDFGLAAKLEFDGDRKRTLCGTPNYIAPEVIDGKQGHSYEVDIWSLGVIIYALIIGKPPFESPDIKSTYKRIKMNSYSFPDHVDISSQAKDLITKIFNLDPFKRPTLDQILEHSFLHMGTLIPKAMPASTLACAPLAAFVKQFMPGSAAISERPYVENTSPFPFNEIKRKGFQNPEGVTSRNEDAKEAVWIKKWVDYSSKYGIGIITNILGYTLTNGATGVIFNDATKILKRYSNEYISFLNSTIYYMDTKDPQEKNKIQKYTLDDYPKEIDKKVLLLKHFKKYLDGDNMDIPSIGEDDENVVYAKKWIRTHHAILFRLSNKIIQVTFEDHTEIIINSVIREIVYINKKGEKTTCPLDTAADSDNIEIVKRLKYTKQVLRKIMEKGSNIPSIIDLNYR